MANTKALKKIDWLLGQMLKEATKKGAPVLRAEYVTAGNPFKILVFTMLSARTRDETTLAAVERIFSVAQTPEEVYGLGEEKLNGMLYGIGFYRTKTKHLLGMCKKLIQKENGTSNYAIPNGIPNKLEELLELPGVGRKTANIVLARAFGKDTLGVDVHVHRISNRLGLIKTKKREETEKKLLATIPKRLVREFNRDLVAFGQTVCLPRNPRCKECPISKVCMKVGI